MKLFETGHISGSDVAYLSRDPHYVPKAAFFNRPWMDVLNPQLLIRYWRKCGRGTTLRVDAGIGPVLMVMTPFGEMRIVE